MKEISMQEITQKLLNKNIKAEFIMSGGGFGTIYIGEADNEGYYEMAVGPSDFVDGIAYFQELCWGIDGRSEATYAEAVLNEEDFTAENVADLIAQEYKKEAK